MIYFLLPNVYIDTYKNLDCIYSEHTSQPNISQSLCHYLMEMKYKIGIIKNDYFYIDKFNKIKIQSNNIQSKGLLENLCQAIQIALNLNVNKNLIQKTIPKIKFEARVQILKEGKIKKKLYKNEKILVDGCHSAVGAKGC